MTRAFLAIVLLFGFCACTGDDDSAGDGGNQGGGSADAGDEDGSGAHSGTKVIVASDDFLHLIDTGTGEELARLEFDALASALHVADDAVLLGGSDGELIVADADTLELRGELALGSHVEAITSRGDEAFVAILGTGTGAAEDGPQIVRVDTQSATEIGRFMDVDINEQHDALISDGDDLIGLVGNGFAIERIDPESGTVTQTAPLGQDPADPDGPRGEFYGYGLLAAAGGRYWVIDDYHDRLLGLDADSFDLAVLKDEADLLEDGGSDHLASNGDELFLTLADLDRIVVFDGTSGEIDRSFDIPDGARAIAVKGDELFVDADESFGDMLVLDAQTGKERKRVPGAFADFIEVR